MDAQAIVAALDLKPLALEGGFFRETYRSGDIAEDLPGRYAGGRRSFSTAIYYLLTPDTFSAMHRLPTDEVYHFYLGDPVEMLQLFEDGTGAVIRIGIDLQEGLRPQVVVPKGTWQGSRLVDGGSVALLGTTMAPGFEFTDFEAGHYADLSVRHPAHERLIAKLTRT